MPQWRTLAVPLHPPGTELRSLLGRR